MTLQRRRGLPAKVWRTTEVLDARGNRQVIADPDSPHDVTVWVKAGRSARAEVAGQQEINLIEIGVSANLEDVGLWSRVEVLGETWDLAAPPTYHHGTRHTRHWTIPLRRRS